MFDANFELTKILYEIHELFMHWYVCTRVCPVRLGMLFWSVMLVTHLELLDRVVSLVRFLTGNGFQCDIAYKIWCNQLHSLYGVLPVPYMCQYGFHEVLWSHIGIRMRLLAEPWDFYFHLSVSVEQTCWLCIRCCGTGGFQEQCQCFC